MSGAEGIESIESSVWTDLAIGVPALLGGLCFAVAVLAAYRVRDALGRINTMSVATSLGFVLFIVAAFAHVTVREGFTWTVLAEALVAVFATFVVVTIASMSIARAVFRSGAPLDPDTDVSDLRGDGREQR